MTVRPHQPQRIPRQPISGWGRYPSVTAEQTAPAVSGEIAALTAKPYLPRGQGRSYGDAALPAADHRSLNSYRLDRFLSFNPLSGVVDAEAGVTLHAILRIAIPRGWFLPVTPGTMFVSLGGAIASNVHGKNHHHCGSLEHFILEAEVATPAGHFVCSPQAHADLFRATVGGYGLTGFITRAKLRLKPIETARLDCLRLRASGLDALFGLLSRHDAGYEYSVAWLDTLARGRKLGRGILMLGNHAPLRGEEKSAALEHADARKLGVPFALPRAFLNRPFLSACNRAFYGFSRRGATREGLEGFFYPLDRIRAWNLLYGKPGFLQYQCAIPDPRGEAGMAAVLVYLSEKRLGAFLSVLKRCGEDTVMLPFCKRGYTLALDIPFRGEVTLRLLRGLDELVLGYAGRVYLTKDARLPAETFRAMYPESGEWMDTVRRYNPEALCNSRMAERLELWRR